MIYSQLRENDRTTRFEVRAIPGHKCQLASGAQASTEAAPKSRTKKTGTAASSATAASTASQSWTIGERDDACWLDLESELRRLYTRAQIDLGLRSGEEGGPSNDLLARLNRLTESLYANESIEDYLSYLGLLNIFEYFRLISQLKRAGNEAANATQVGIVGEEYFGCRKMALELDLAELTEWLVAHDIGLPNLALFFPSEYKSDDAPAAAAPVAKGRKKKGADAEQPEEAPQPVIPDALKHFVELVRLHQAEPHQLAVFVDQVKQRGNYETAREAIQRIKDDVAPWIDPDHFEAVYENMKREEALETRRAQAVIQRQREAFDRQPKRGQKLRTKERGLRTNRKQIHLNDLKSPLDEFAESVATEDTDELYEQAMQRALERPEGMEFVPDGFIEGDDVHASEAGHDEDGGFDRDGAEEPFELGFDADDADDFAEYPEEGMGGEKVYAVSGDAEGEDFDDNDRRPMAPGDRRHNDQGGGEQGGEGRPRRRRRRGRAGDKPAPQQGQHNGPQGGPRGPRPAPQGRGHRDHGPAGGPPPFRGPAAGGPPPPGAKRPRRRRGKPGPGGNGGGGRGVDFDEVQPISNYSPGLTPGAAAGGPGKSAGGAGKPRRWKR